MEFSQNPSNGWIFKLGVETFYSSQVTTDHNQLRATIFNPKWLDQDKTPNQEDSAQLQDKTPQEDTAQLLGYATLSHFFHERTTRVL